jgi:hypothetical protein
MAASLRKISYVIISLCWAVLVTILIIRHYGLYNNLTSVSGKNIIPEELYVEQWFGVYHNSDKIGFSRRKIDTSEGGYRIDQLVKIKLNILNSIKDIETVSSIFLNSDLRLDSFDVQLKSDENMNIHGSIEGQNFVISIEALGAKSEKSIVMKEMPTLNNSVFLDIIRKGIQPGKRFAIPVFDPFTLAQDNMNIEINQKERIMAMGKEREAYRLRGLLRGVEFYMWITEKGVVLKEESPLGFTLVKETKETALQLERPYVDLIRHVAVPFNLRLPSDTNYLKVRISNVDLQKLDIDGGRQVLKDDVIEIQKEILVHDKKTEGENVLSKPPLYRDKTERLSDEHLADTFFIQSKHPRIMSLARKIVNDEKDAMRAAEKINEWVYKNIEKSPAVTVPMAIEVLRTKRGDCNEHTNLFAALSRAAGIPTRISVGLVYDKGYFYYHAWPEIFVNQWVAIDPTLGQFPADAAHVRLLTGDIDEQIKLLSVINKIRFEGIEYR